ncbi:hypothetical protein [Exiguobacterium sp. SH3S1]|uniref:hypothetical protein n=1 Tax=Exiguobacterium sp. SH3S1 TaxID=2510955 RepID=UPI001039FA14|nr:hypothetical protein [Exiguobacterium sp. SH3S1]TCI62638.1 hypothetical protein EVJ26_06930 [Exiguobacterium sp. SH3S1]
MDVTREAMYRMIQACLMGRTDYVTEEGISIYHRGTHETTHLSPVLDALIECYLTGTTRSIHLSLHTLAVTAGVKPDEAMRALLALSDVFLVSHHIEERLLKIQQIDTDVMRTLSVHITFSAWLSYHLDLIRHPEKHRVG